MLYFDSHAHVYPEFWLDALFSAFLANSARRAPKGAALALAVPLRSFQQSLEGALMSAGRRSVAISRPDREGGPWRLSDASGAEVFVYPARQVATRERIELLAFFGEEMVPDGLPLKETARRLAGAGYAPALAWGRGKWLFGRARIVRDFLLDPEMRKIAPFVCDSALRPWFWPEPLFGVAKSRGFRMLTGSDPLPGAGNERRAGCRGTVVDAGPDAPARELLVALAAQPAPRPDR